MTPDQSLEPAEGEVSGPAPEQAAPAEQAPAAETTEAAPKTRRRRATSRTTAPAKAPAPAADGEAPGAATPDSVGDGPAVEEADAEDAPATSAPARPARRTSTRSRRASTAKGTKAAKSAKAAPTETTETAGTADAPGSGAPAEATDSTGATGLAESAQPAAPAARAPRRRRVTAAQAAPEATPTADDESSGEPEVLATPTDITAEASVSSAVAAEVASGEDAGTTDSADSSDSAGSADAAGSAGSAASPRSAAEADADAEETDEAPRLPAASLLFQAPDPSRARRRRKVTAVQAAPQSAPEVESAAPAAPAEQADEQPRDEERPAATASSRGRRRRKVTAAQATPETAPAPQQPAAAGETADPDGPGTSGTEETPAAEEVRPRRSRRARGRRTRSQDGEADETPETTDSAESAEGAGTAGEAPDEAEEMPDDTADDSEGPEGPEGTDTAEGGRRKRRRGGRGRRSRSRSDEATEPAEATDPADEAPAGPGADDEADGDEEDEAGSGSRRRRRRRSRSTRAEGGREGRDVRDEVTALKGSTRLEAKRQRRREGRAAGRRRPIVTEAEFLARRESVDRQMIIREQDGLNQIAVLEDGLLVEHYVARHTQTSMVGNVYVGRVQNVLPSMEAAFVDLGKGRNAVLYAGEVNWDAAGMEGKPRRIEDALKSGDTVLVQVTKDPIGHKGARLTSQVTLAGRYLVLVPGGTMTGISRKLPDTERARLKKILKRIVPDAAGVIVRTAAEGASEEQLTADVERLLKQWEAIDKKATRVLAGSGKAPVLLKGEPELAVRVVRDVFNEDFRSLIVQGPDAWTTISEYVTELSPDLADRLQHWVSPEDVFSAHRIDEQLAKGFDRKVWLPSGGTLIIDRTEAMTVIDVNTGRFTGAGGTLEETVTRNNIEAAEEIVRQLRLRDIGGMVVIDFVDMVLESNRDLVLRRLVECLGRDRTRHQVTEVTSLGLVQMTRKRVGQGLVEAFSTPCECCGGRGFIVHSEPVENQQADLSTSASRSSGRGRGRKGSSEAASQETPRKGSSRRRGKEDADDVIDDQTRAAVRGALAQIAAAAEHAHKEADPAPEEGAAEAGAGQDED
ncbi:Rne/Rng family ribonuclease [Actinomyces sp. 186855]|uniref:Rne/Rng family ribonuclease n=4 Tax=Actinomyces TaxID=1654 RepID=UPI002017798C|nr:MULTISPECIES: Rne/Rng family ribonuclease [unclassified Actinomyces]MCL3776643.1 Rne/Rng family ribonuclease [Actinomyces sp. AC-20-1]MCL3791922.1 Rne/Rng family ribonuclease [Actinomyces sp. 186855]